MRRDDPHLWYALVLAGFAVAVALVLALTLVISPVPDNGLVQPPDGITGVR